MSPKISISFTYSNQNTASLIFNMRAVSHVRNKTVKYIALAGGLLSANCNVPM